MLGSWAGCGKLQCCTLLRNPQCPAIRDTQPRGPARIYRLGDMPVFERRVLGAQRPVKADLPTLRASDCAYSLEDIAAIRSNCSLPPTTDEAPFMLEVSTVSLPTGPQTVIPEGVQSGVQEGRWL